GLPRQVPARSPDRAPAPGRQCRRARQPRVQPGPGRAPRQRGVVRAAGQRRFRRPAQRDQLRRGTPGLHRVRRGLLVAEPPRRAGLQRQVMRAATSLALLAAMLCASPLALAQRASLADRVAALEQRAAGDQNGAELVNQITQLRVEVKELRGQVEQLQQELEQARQSQRSQYLDLDGRLNRLEGGGAAPAPQDAPVEPRAQAPASSAPAAGDAGGDASAGVAATGVAAMAGMDERSAYDFAFDALRGGDYAESARRFRDFLGAYPGGQYAPNALYWLGESYYVTQNYALAGEQFQALLDRYPNHDKAPGALLKLGLSQYGLKLMPQADATLREVVRRYPD